MENKAILQLINYNGMLGHTISNVKAVLDPKILTAG